MNDQKLENQLTLALDSTQREREESLDLDVGYDKKDQTWELIVRYSGNIEELEGDGILVTPLLNQYAIVILPQSEIESFASRPGIEYVEKPKRLFFALNQARSAACINQVQGEPYQLKGKGVWVACIDSGIDYSHPDFLRPDGSSRILYLWDQTIPGRPPQGYEIGTEYRKDEIDQALSQGTERYKIVPSQDVSGHGTAVMGIAAGNGAASGGSYRGVAPDSELIVVKLGLPGETSFPRTTELMQAVDYVVKLAAGQNKPLVINLSFGNSYGSHSGESLLETYLDAAAAVGRTVICVGTGNDGALGGHTSGVLAEGSVQEVQLAVSAYESTLNLQLWKRYEDEMAISLIHPDGTVVGPIQPLQEPQRIRFSGTELLFYYGEPSPYSTAQEIYFEFLPIDTYVDSGIWRIRLVPGEIVQGDYDMWIPGGQVLNAATRFYQPTPERTLTIPSTARNVIAVGAYNSRMLSYAPFSGRGYTRVTNEVKPTLVAPGVDIMAPRAGGGYEAVTGTSFATPFVTGSAALLMEWGIIKGNDPYLYGEKVKAYLIKGTQKLPGYETFPNSEVGYGALCVRKSIPN